MSSGRSGGGGVMGTLPSVHKFWKRMNKEGNILFNDAIITFYLQFYGVGHTVKIVKEKTRCRHYISWSF